MKKIILFAVALALILCGCGKRIGPANVLDNDTGKTYSLGDSKDIFDSAFGPSTFNERMQEWDYLSKMLSVAYDDENRATKIRASGESNRFSFFNFDFSKPIEDIKGRYSEHEMSGVTSYSIYFSVDGKKIDFGDTMYMDKYISHTLFVYTEDNEFFGRKNGAYGYYYIEISDGLGLEKP